MAVPPVTAAERLPRIETPGPVSTAGWRPLTEESGSLGDVLRRGLFLLLDALLLEIGASAGTGRSDELPWRRWLDEDLDLAVGMALACRSVHSELPAVLAPPGVGPDTGAVLDGLTARYAALAGELTTATEGARTGRDGDPPEETWPTTTELDRFRDRIRGRLQELDRYRVQESAGRDVEHGGRVAPGEFLG